MREKELTAIEVLNGFAKPIPIDRFDLDGVTLEDQPTQMGLCFEPALRDRSKGTVSLNLLESPGTRLEMNPRISIDQIPEGKISIREIFRGGNDGAQDSVQSFIEDTATFLILEVICVRISRPYPGGNTIKVTVMVSNFTACALCTIYQLKGFLKQDEQL